MITNVDAIRSLAPGASYAIVDDEIIWNSPDITQPTQSEIDAEIVRLQTEYDALQYQRDRKSEYPALDEIVVALWEAVIEERMASSIDLQGKRTAVKNKYPKP
tara:strand:+ start:714 stop:1022 length:309 start_codon:yes stop_codon:yes gene_type:complete